MPDSEPFQALTNGLQALDVKVAQLFEGVQELEKFERTRAAEIQKLTKTVTEASASLGKKTTDIEARLRSIVRTQTPSELGSGTSFLEILKVAAGAVIILAAPFYTTGWIYLQQYYKSFGLSTYDLNLSLYDILVFSFRVISHDWQSRFASIGVVLFLGFLWQWKRTRTALSTPFGIASLLSVLLVSGLPVSRCIAQLGEKDARKDMRADNPNLPLVSVAIDPKEFQPDLSEYLTFDKLEFKLLIHANGKYYVFRPLGMEGGPLQLFIIPDDRVRRLRVQRGV